jgi:alpha-L-rhamnosidase
VLPVERATLRVCGLGCCEVRLNGQPVDRRVLDPAETDYDRRAFYATFDVTDLLSAGRNAVGVILGDGWYRQTVAFARPGQPAAFGRQGLILQLEIEHGGGRTDRVVSDESWKCTLEGPLVKNAIFAGELYDARREMPGWDRPGFDDQGWSAVEILPPLTPRLESQLIPPIRVVETVKPVAISHPRPAVWVFDMGSNLAGFARLKAKAPAGTMITMKFADTLDRNGLAFQPESLNMGAKGVDAYVCRGGDEPWEPRFTYHSFRYVQVEGLPDKPTLDTLEGRFVTNDLEPALHFECSNGMLNRLHAALVRTGMENTQHKWTDCPSRERSGWMTYPSFLLLMHNFDAQPLLAKLVADMEQKTHDMRVGDRQYANVTRGVILGRPRGSFIEEQAVSTILLPWELYLQYGDRRLLESHYPFMRDTMQYFAANARGGVLESNIGDWHDALPSLDRPSVEAAANKADEPPPSSLASTHATALRVEAAQRAGRKQAGGYSIHTQPAVVATACFHEAARAMSAVARLLNQPNEAEQYDRLADRIQAGFIAAFYMPGEASFGSQTSDALALWQGMVPPGSDDRVLKSLVHDVLDTHHGHFTTGQLGTDRLLQVLSQRGRDDVAYTLMTQKEFPSFALMLDSGSTTTWETWGEAILSQTPLGQTTPIAAMRPMNHIEFTGVDAWFLQQVAGIRRDDNQPGFKAAVLKPHLVRQLDWARAEYHTVRGWIGSDWRRQADRFTWKIMVPPNMTATAYVPAGSADSVSEGGRPATQVGGVKRLRSEDGYAVFELQSGCFEFHSSL